MKVRVFIVVDDPIMGNLLEVRLVEAGYDACYLEAPESALAAVSAGEPPVRPVIVADPDGPGMADGAVSQRFAAAGITPSLILLPAGDQPARIPPSAETPGPVFPLPAPFDMTALRERLDAIAAETDPSPGPPPKTESPADSTGAGPSSQPDGPPSPPAEPAPTPPFPAGPGPGIPGLLTSFHERGVTGLLEVRDLPDKAAIYLDGGHIVHALYGAATGEKALHRIIRAPDGAPQFHPQPRLATETRTVQAPFDALMAAARREADALRRVKPQVFDSLLSIDEERLARSPEVTEHRGLGHILTLVETHGRMRRVMDESRMTDLQTYTNLVYLLKQGIVRARSQERIGLRIVTDSTADLPESVVSAHDPLLVVPISVRLNGKTYQDGVDIAPSRFYTLLKKTKGFPETIPPSPEDFYRVFEGAVGDADLLGIFLSQKLSATGANARIAVDRYGDAYRIRRHRLHGHRHPPQIIVVDSRSVSLGMGLLVTAAAEKASEGASLAEIQDYVTGLIPSLRIFFAVESLAYLQRSGRLSRGKAMLGSMMGIRPILGIRNGEVIHLDQVTGEKRIPEVLAEWIEWSLPDPTPALRVGVMHADSPERADRLAATLTNRFDCRHTTVSEIGPVVGAHCGPDTVGVAVLPV